MKTLLYLLAFVVLGAFLGILVWNVERWDLRVIVGVVVLFAAYDLFVHERRTDT